MILPPHERRTGRPRRRAASVFGNPKTVRRLRRFRPGLPTFSLVDGRKRDATLSADNLRKALDEAEGAIAGIAAPA